MRALQENLEVHVSLQLCPGSNCAITVSGFRKEGSCPCLIRGAAKIPAAIEGFGDSQPEGSLAIFLSRASASLPEQRRKSQIPSGTPPNFPFVPKGNSQTPTRIPSSSSICSHCPP